MQGKTVLITGATAGLGQVTALELAKMGATVVGIGRSPQKCADAASSLRSASGNANIEYLVADLSVQAQVRRVAEEFKQKYPQLHVLINNAGAYYQNRHVSADGIEMTFALNHLSYFLLTQLLLDRLKASAPARIVNVSSGAHTGGKINFDDLQLKRKYGGWSAYAQSKLANVLFTYELARHLEGTGVTATALHPGFVASNFAHNNFKGAAGTAFKLLFKTITSLAAITPEEGAKTQIYLASSPQVEGVSGQYFVKQKAARSSLLSYDRAAAQRLWEISETMTGAPHTSLSTN
jgi:NAD(P)-dependent dehydrogenase (short-subunit alcohol dehydrogenase family)